MMRSHDDCSPPILQTSWRNVSSLVLEELSDQIPIIDAQRLRLTE